MKKESLAILIMISFISLLAGCSQRDSNPVVSHDTHSDNSIKFPDVEKSQINRILLGTWTGCFNIDNQNVAVTLNRSTNAHYNVTSIIPDPYIILNSYDPITHVIDIDVTIRNPYQVNVYDVRLIIFTDDEFHTLLNPDDWTALYDIPGGKPINPFKAYAENEPSHLFAGGSYHTNNLVIYLPEGNTNVDFAIDASFPSNCSEPYSIDNFSQGILYEQGDLPAPVQVDVFDWQDDTNAVYLHCPDITSETLTPFSRIDTNTWAMDLINNAGAQCGIYQGVILAKSSNSGSIALYDFVEITISPGPYPTNPQLVYTLSNFINEPHDVVVKGNYAYISRQLEKTQILDISDPLQPVLVKEFDFRSADIVFQGNYAYASCTEYPDTGIKIIDISDPPNAVVVGFYFHYPGPYCIAVKENYAYMGYSGYGIKILDVSDPSNPQYIKQIPVTATSDIYIEDNYMYTASGIIYVFDISDPLNPVELGDGGYISTFRIQVVNDYAYVLTTSLGYHFAVFDIRDPSNILETDYAVILNPTGFALRDNYAYVTSNSYFDVIDISNAYDIKTVKHIQIPGGNEVALYNNYALVATLGGLYIFDISDPLNTMLVTSFGSFEPSNIEIEGYNAFVSENYASAKILDISEPLNPRIMTSLNADAKDFAINGDYAYVATYLYFTVLDISDIYHPVTISNVALGDRISGIKVNGDLAYAAVQNTGLKILDVSDPNNPIVIGEAATQYALEVDIKGDYAYVADGSAGLKIINISDPSNPELTGSASGCWALGVTVVHDYAYIADSLDGFIVINVSDPANPVQAGLCDLNDQGWDIKVLGNYAYVAAKNGLRIIDISDPSNPQNISSVYTNGSAQGVAIYDRYAFLADYEKGLHVIQLW